MAAYMLQALFCLAEWLVGSYDCTPLHVRYGALVADMQEHCKYLTLGDDGKWTAVSFDTYQNIHKRSFPQATVHLCASC